MKGSDDRDKNVDEILSNIYANSINKPRKRRYSDRSGDSRGSIYLAYTDRYWPNPQKPKHPVIIDGRLFETENYRVHPASSKFLKTAERGNGKYLYVPPFHLNDAFFRGRPVAFKLTFCMNLSRRELIKYLNRLRGKLLDDYINRIDDFIEGRN